MECVGTCFDSDGALCASSCKVQVCLDVFKCYYSLIKENISSTLDSCNDELFIILLLILWLRQALQLYKGDPAQVIAEIINTIEGGPPVDVSAVRSM